MSFTDQKPRIATEKYCKAPWGGVENGELFRCYMCGHRFKPGDIFRWVSAVHLGTNNLVVCDKCDGPDILQRWVDRVKEYEERFWWAGNN